MVWSGQKLVNYLILIETFNFALLSENQYLLRIKEVPLCYHHPGFKLEVFYIYLFRGYQLYRSFADVTIMMLQLFRAKFDLYFLKFSQEFKKFTRIIVCNNSMFIGLYSKIITGALTQFKKISRLAINSKILQRSHTVWRFIFLFEARFGYLFFVHNINCFNSKARKETFVKTLENKRCSIFWILVLKRWLQKFSFLRNCILQTNNWILGFIAKQ
eukprot:TRINITY_DN1928_c0_g1_i5.p1 TRINITY_DN1928_c0_g1~~TRINITY_DN1928_c0_g1_i5.p1  ORF type:complete len:215 (-),score=-5.84 TRINITY_DN1928_c0_g1_i5:2052-2696(-)